MNYQEFVQRVQHNMHETIYEDSEGRSILIIDLLDAFAFANKLIEAEREACAKIAETPQGEYEVVVACGTEPAPHRIPQHFNWQDIATAIRARGQA